MDEGTTGPRKGPKIPEPEPEEPTQPAPPDRSRPQDGPTNLPPTTPTTPSPPVAPTGPRTATPRDDEGEEPRKAKPRPGPGRPRWNFRNMMASYGNMGELGYGGEAIPELVEYLQQQEAQKSRRQSRIQALLAGQQAQSPLFLPR